MRSRAAASESSAEDAAHRVLKEGGTAGDALIAGFLAGAAARAGVLLCPVQVLVAGPGVGARAFDGRSRQPGLAVPRPRGYVKGQPVPDAAYVAAPASLGALALVHAYDSALPFQRLADPALEVARTLGAAERRKLLARVGRVGPSALREAQVARPLLAVAGRAEGGLLSEQDLADVRPESALPRELQVGARRRALLLPWAAPEAPQRHVEIVVAADARGVLGVLSYAPDEQGIAVPELGLTLPREAILVRRGIPRVSPGEPLPSPAAIGIGLADHVAFLAFGVTSARPLSSPTLSSTWSPPGATATQLLAGAREAAGGGSAVALVRSPDKGGVQKLLL
ncbi:MAG TPA: hypothetical protein VF881_03150 [Polyangiaceae bacterium]